MKITDDHWVEIRASVGNATSESIPAFATL